MFDKLAEILHLAYRQKWAVEQAFDTIKNLFNGGFSLRRIAAGLLAAAELMGMVIFDTPVTPRGPALDLSGYELVFEDEFNGDALNTEYWHARANGERRGGYNADSQITVKDGNLILKGSYLTDGEYGEGWYAGMVALNKKYNKGYFEIRCKVNDSPDFWSAFWIQADHPYNHELSKGGVGGAELDIFESGVSGSLFPRYSVSQTIHCNGVDDDVENIDSRILGDFKGNNITEEYNTYGLKWTEDEYIFYINGVETTRSSFGLGVSQEEEEVIVSLELPGDISLDHGTSTEFTVDYVKIWQTK